MSGFAVRSNGSCLSNEVDGGVTVKPFHICCPTEGTVIHGYNSVCCNTHANCTASLVAKPRCANRTWDLYDNNGYFCCRPGMKGYANIATDSDGCASKNFPFGAKQLQLAVLSTGIRSSTISSTSSTTSTTSTEASTSFTQTSSFTATPSSDGQQNSKHSSNTGAVAGGVVAGVVGIILIALATWFFRRRLKKQHLRPGEKSSGYSYLKSGTSEPIELPTRGGTPELFGQHGTSELPSSEPTTVHSINPNTNPQKVGETAELA